MNFPVVFLAALIPMVVGFVWYGKATFGNAWMKAADMTEEKVKSGNMAVIFGVSYVLSVLLAMVMTVFVIHQSHIMSLFMNMEGFGVEGSEIQLYYDDFMAKYGTMHRTFGHGAAHGLFGGIFFMLPILATNALFERKGFKYIAINAGYWLLTLVLMGGVICQFS
ncbi:MAG: DUF1761 domain-containing protein [Flavobacteriales bacterium]|nr:DUF1761 domain-containing protein [Flavobacteriales bacterium]